MKRTNRPNYIGRLDDLKNILKNLNKNKICFNISLMLFYSKQIHIGEIKII